MRNTKSLSLQLEAHSRLNLVKVSSSWPRVEKMFHVQSELWRYLSLLVWGLVNTVWSPPDTNIFS